MPTGVRTETHCQSKTPLLCFAKRGRHAAQHQESAAGDQATHPRGAACSNSRPQPGSKLLGVWRGVGGFRWVGRSAARVHRGGLVGTTTYTPQNDPHDTLILLNIHKWGKKFFSKNLPISSGSHQPRSALEVTSGVKISLCFSPIFEISTKF